MIKHEDRPEYGYHTSIPVDESKRHIKKLANLEKLEKHRKRKHRKGDPDVGNGNM